MKNPRPKRAFPGREAGFALMTVLFVLLTMFILVAPFLLTARNADKASGQIADRTEVRIAKDTAARHGRLQLFATHPVYDETPDWDSLDELDVSNRFPDGFLDANDPRGVMWDLDVTDVAGQIDLNSASPHVVGNVMGLVTRLAEPLTGEATEIVVQSTRGFEPSGYLWLSGELVAYESIEGRTFMGCQRGLNTEWDDEDETWITDGPRPPSGHGVGAYVLDQRAVAPATWRTLETDEVRAFDAVEQVRESELFSLSGEIGNETLLALSELGSVYGGARAGQDWQRAARLVSPVEGGVDQSIAVDSPRWFAQGSTVWITDGQVHELRYVQRLVGGRIVLDRVLENDFDAWTAVVRVLARRPVNLNTATAAVLEALFWNLQLDGQNERITRPEAQALAALTIAARPFTGHEDWMRRIVLPAAGIEELPGEDEESPRRRRDRNDTATAIQPRDALALYINGINANDARLAFSTMPFSYTTRDVYGLELRASVNAPSGVERTAGVRERVEVVTPQEELFYMWHRQVDYDEALRLDRGAPYWATGPAATSRWDGDAIPPSRVWPHFGTLDGRPYVPGITAPVLNSEGEEELAEHVFASTESNAGFLQLWPSRLPESNQWQGRSIHFDHETRTLEGRYFPDQTLLRSPEDELVAWTSAAEGMLARGLSFSMWIQPREIADSVLLDLGDTSREVDRVLLAIEGENLVLRVLDGFGDHVGTDQEERAEVLFPLAAGDGPGLPTDTWTHVEIDVTGNRPDQMHMRVNGTAHGVVRPGMTRLASDVAQGAGVIPVDSTEGFPARGVARIGNELIEYEVTGANTLRAMHGEEGEAAGFGGRTARERFILSADGSGVPLDLDTITVSHPQGTTVTHYGYSAMIDSVLPAGSSTLQSDLGHWRVCRVVGVSDPPPDPILAGLGYFGLGFESTNESDLILTLGDAPLSQAPPEDFMTGFHQEGGYAAIIQRQWFATGDQSGLSATTQMPLGGVEIIRYSGYTDDVLHIAARGDVAGTELELVPDQDDGQVGGRRVFVIDWEGTTVATTGELIQSLMDWGAYVIPISLAAPGASDLSFLDPAPDQSEFAQITRTDLVELTEWVRYDEIQTTYGQLVRDDPDALAAALVGITGGLRVQLDGPPPSPSMEMFTGAPHPPFGPPSASTSAPASPATPGPSARAARAGTQWDPFLGESEDDDYPFSAAVADLFRFRGVLDTKRHEQVAGALILPVFHMPDRGVEGGRPGALDGVFAVGPEPDHVGWPLTVHRGHQPSLGDGGQAVSVVRTWMQPEGQDAAVAGESSLVPDPGFIANNRIYVALRDACPEPMSPGGLDGFPTAATDSRIITRLVKFPSGERPRIVSGVGVGTGFNGATDLGVPSAVGDEIAFFTPEFAVGLPNANPTYSTQAGQLIVAEPFDTSSDNIRVFANAVRIADRVYGAQGAIGGLPEDGGLLRIGEEILAYESRDVDTGDIRLCVEGRGLLGTFEQPHQTTEPVSFLEHVPMGVLTVDIGPGDSVIPLASLDGFPTEGTVLIDDELIHYTRLRNGSLEMPRASSEPGEMDEDGDGIFRGRFGTAPSAHAAGTPVIWFPFRYWDRWADRADCPELSYFGLDFSQPGAWWNGVFWESEPATSGQCQIGVAQRVDPSVPWDADPDLEAGLDVQWQGRREGELIPIDTQADRVEWRVFVRYDPGAFDPEGGMSHGWKETPRFRRLGVSFYGPGLVLRSVDR